MCCNAGGSLFCGMMSTFGCIFMVAIAYLISIEYPYLGEWHPEVETLLELHEMSVKSSKQCYTVAGVYGAFAAISVVSYCFQSRRK